MHEVERCAESSRSGTCCNTTSWWEMFAHHAGIDVVMHCADDGSDDMTLGVGDFVANFWHETFSTERVDGRTYTSFASVLLRLAVTLHACDNDETFIHDADEFALFGRAFLDSAVTRSLPGVSVVCPVAEIAGEFHYLVRGSGVVVPWSVMGDSRDSVEVCAECASHSVGGAL